MGESVCVRACARARVRVSRWRGSGAADWRPLSTQLQHSSSSSSNNGKCSSNSSVNCADSRGAQEALGAAGGAGAAPSPPTHRLPLTDRLAAAALVATTCLGTGSALLAPAAASSPFDLCIVDEASQLVEPVALGPMLLARSTCLVGDHEQLPPLVVSPAARAAGMDVSLLRRLAEDPRSSQPHPATGLSPLCILRRQYRMNAAVMALVNALIYDGPSQPADRPPSPGDGAPRHIAVERAASASAPSAARDAKAGGRRGQASERALAPPAGRALLAGCAQVAARSLFLPRRQAVAGQLSAPCWSWLREALPPTARVLLLTTDSAMRGTAPAGATCPAAATGDKGAGAGAAAATAALQAAAAHASDAQAAAPAPESSRAGSAAATGTAAERGCIHRDGTPAKTPVPGPFGETAAPGGGVWNESEADAVACVVIALVAAGADAGEVCVVSPYRAQLSLVRERLSAVRSMDLSAVEVATVDRYQGRDKDAVVVSLVRANSSGSLGSLLSDVRRVNVMLTRAKRKLVFVGSAATIEAAGPDHPMYRLESAAKRVGTVAPVEPDSMWSPAACERALL
mmetsp:Transcript_7848/g.31013  ORF Transcript_7848/g.31013 Transcript_7848/m.31013 type:complete len:572 (-) Transcript_7848:14-1729(-)